MARLRAVLLPSTLVGWSQVVLALGVAVAALQYSMSVRKEAADILVRMEERFQSLRPVATRLERPATYAEIAPVLEHPVQLKRTPSSLPLSSEEAEAIADVDSLLRFFYVCSLLDGRLRVKRNALHDAYYYHLRALRDEALRPELCRYLEGFYPRLWAWLHWPRFPWLWRWIHG